METLFILKKKFGNGRVIRGIYEFIDERAYWLKQYRQVINYSSSKLIKHIVPDRRPFARPSTVLQCPVEYDIFTEGVRTPYLYSTPVSHANEFGLKQKHTRPLSYYPWGYVAPRNQLSILLGDLYVHCVPYITPSTMILYTLDEYKFDNEMLHKNCIENNLLDPMCKYSRKRLLAELMKI